LAAILGFSFTLADLLYIVFLNDWGDSAVDRLKREMFPTSSPKTIPDGVLAPHSLLVAGLGAGAAALTVALLLEMLVPRPGFTLGAVAALALFWTYTLPPFRLNYRGGGELLETLGVGIALPWLNAFAQSGSVWHPTFVMLLPLAPLSLASAVASGLSDERSDRAGGKRTLASSLGNAMARRSANLCLLIGTLLWPLAGLLAGAAHWRCGAMVGGAVTLVFTLRAWRRSPNALTDAFDEQRIYKRELHRAIWWSAASAAIVAMICAGILERST
jgi:1,4-dihydroxy-2-naphthoate octaprenyltransferase/chlorophyll synthase